MNELRTPYLLQTNLPPALISPSFFIIEKNIAIATMIRWILELAGYRSTHITEVSALSELSLPNSPALTLLDISLPLRSGSNVLADIHSTYASLGIPSLIIVLTTNKDIQKEVKAMGYRALMKPFHLQDLHQAIQETLYSRGTRYNCSLHPQKNQRLSRKSL